MTSNKKIAELTQKMLDLYDDIKYSKDLKEISKMKEEIMWIVEDINLIERQEVKRREIDRYIDCLGGRL